jgi:Xaa-Pro dipeptidase
MSAKRLEYLLELIADAGLDGVVFNPGPSLFYLTGLPFHLMERPTTLIIVPGQVPALVLPELESAKLSQSSLPLQAFPFGDNPAEWGRAFQAAAAALNLSGKRFGVESTHLRYLEISYLQAAAPGLNLVPGDSALNGLRLHKDSAEIAKMRKAAVIAQNALKATLPLVKVGVTERELAAELSLQLLRAGSEPEFPLAPIVASGPNSANPHAAPSDRAIQTGDLLLFDWGARYEGYCSDITRTFFIGEIKPELQAIYQAVAAANSAGRAIGKPGLRAGDVDHAARAEIVNAGYGQFFTHRTGHGLGMEDHESPYMFAENDQLLEEGMVYTVEPGIYLPNQGGVRIEDDMVVTADGCMALTDFPHDLTVL